MSLDDVLQILLRLQALLNVLVLNFPQLNPLLAELAEIIRAMQALTLRGVPDPVVWAQERDRFISEMDRLLAQTRGGR